MQGDDGIDKRVTVAIRVRPKIATAVNATQTAEHYHPETVVKMSDITLRVADATTITGMDGSSNNGPSSSASTGGGSNKPRVNTFNFDFIFDKDSPQLEVYEEVALDAVDAALQSGSNASILTYGQTGSGKTHTILGAVGKNPLSDDVITPNTGIFLRVLRDILSFADSQKKTRHVVVVLSVTEVYLDLVKDLLGGTPGAIVVGGVSSGDSTAATSSASAPTSKTGSNGPAGTVKVIIDGDAVRIPELSHRPIENLRDAVTAYNIATSRRVIRATEANDTSSRSHALFTVDIFQQRRSEDVNPDPLPIETLLALRDSYGTATTNPTSSTTTTTTSTSAAGGLARKQSAALLVGRKTSFTSSSPTPGSPVSSMPSASTSMRDEALLLDDSITSTPSGAAVDPTLFTPPIIMGKASNPVIRVTPKTVQQALQQAQSAYAGCTNSASANIAAAAAVVAATSRSSRGSISVAALASSTSLGAQPPSTTPLAAAVGVTAPLPPIIFSRIVLTDLAGSEKQKHSGAKGEGFEEMKKINASLTALGNVVHALFCASSHVPYRDAKLTVLLRSSFATPFSKIVLIANCAPTSLTYDETMSTIFFADKVKVMKVDGAGMNAAASAAAAEAIRQEADFLRVAKKQEELVAEMRILKAAYWDYKPVIRLSLASNQDETLYSTLGFARTNKASSTKEGRSAFQQLTVENGTAPSAKKAQEHATTSRENEVNILKKCSDDIRSNIVDDSLKSYKQRRTVLETELANNEKMAAERLQELDTEAARLSNEITGIEKHHETSELEIKRLGLHKLEKLKPGIARCTSDEVTLTQSLLALERAFAEKYKDEQVSWEAETALQKLRDSVFTRVKSFWKKRLQMGIIRLQYIGTSFSGGAGGDQPDMDGDSADLIKGVNMLWDALETALREEEKTRQNTGVEAEETSASDKEGVVSDREILSLRATTASLLNSEWLRSEASKWEKEGELFEIRHWVQEAVMVMARNAVTRAIKNARKLGGGNIAAPPPKHQDPNAGTVRGESVSASLYPMARPPSKNSGASTSSTNNPYAALRPTTTFDNPSLIRQIHSYMITGCSLLKHTRHGAPHFRYFALQIEESKSLLRLYWAPEDVVASASENTPLITTMMASSKSRHLDLFSVFKVIIGRSNNSTTVDGGDVVDEESMDEDYYKRFTVYYYAKGNGGGGEERSLDLTAETIAEMEAWVIGICSISRCNPKFEFPIRHKRASSWEGLCTAVDPLVADVTSRWHIQPKMWMATESQIRTTGTKLGLSKNAAEAAVKLKNAVLSGPISGPPPAAQSAIVTRGSASSPPPPASLAAVPPSSRPTPLSASTASSGGGAARPPPLSSAPPKTRPPPMNTTAGSLPPRSVADVGPPWLLPPQPQQSLFSPPAMTPGVLRQMLQIDIFRATAAWYVFVRLGMLAGVPTEDETGLPVTYLDFEDEEKKQRRR